MIERKIIKDKLMEFMIGEYIGDTLERVGYSHTEVHQTPLGEKIVVHSARPGLVVGPKGSNIKKLTKVLKAKFNLENPQIEIEEVTDPNVNAALVAEYIAGTLERFGASGFKGVGYRTMENAIRSGALGVEILVSGKIPSSRARTWRFYKGYLKKCGDVALSDVDVAYTVARLKTGVVGIQVRIMPPNITLPDSVKLQSELVTEEESREQTTEEKKAAEKVSEESAEESAEESDKKEPKEASSESKETPDESGEKKAE
jgi:small subunit ribosomal protein S3